MVLELLQVRAFWCKKLCYIWDEDTKMFTKLVGLDNGIRNEEFYNFDGINEYEQFLRYELDIIRCIPNLLRIKIINQSKM